MHWCTEENEEEHVQWVRRRGGVIRNLSVHDEKLFYIWRLNNKEYVAYGAYRSRPRDRIYDDTIRFIDPDRVIYLSMAERHQFLDGSFQNPVGYHCIIEETLRFCTGHTASYLAIRDGKFHYVAGGSEGKKYRLILQYTLCWFNGQPFYLAVTDSNKPRVGRVVYGHREIARFDWWEPESFCIKDGLPWLEAGCYTGNGGQGRIHVIHGTSINPPFSATDDERLAHIANVII